MIATNHVCPKTCQISPLQFSLGQTIIIQLGWHIQTIIKADNTEDFEIHLAGLDNDIETLWSHRQWIDTKDYYGYNV